MTRTNQIVLSIFVLIFTFIGCSEIKTNDPKKAYKHWAGAYPSKDLNLLNGQYWESAHWTKEYVLFLKFKPTKEWWDEFLKQNDISVDKGEWTAPSDAPAWFNPTKNTIRYGGGDHFNQSRFFRDTLTRVCFIYEIPEGTYALEVSKIGYRCNDAFSTYLSMGKPSQLTKQQVAQIKSQNDGSPVSKEIITVKAGAPCSKELEIRENDVFFINLIRL